MPTEPKREALIEAIAEAERFVRSGKAALKSFRRVGPPTGAALYEWWFYDSPLWASAKRASMDASRALARLRGSR